MTVKLPNYNAFWLVRKATDEEGEVVIDDVLGSWFLEGKTPTRDTLSHSHCPPPRPAKKSTRMIKLRCVDYEKTNAFSAKHITFVIVFHAFIDGLLCRGTLKKVTVLEFNELINYRTSP